MSTRADELILMAARGERVAKIREALRMSGDEFAARIQQEAQSAFHFHLPFDKYKVSKLEGGTRDMSAEEAVILTRIDPEQRSLSWLVFGVVRKVAIGHAPPPQRLVTTGRATNDKKSAG